MRYYKQIDNGYITSIGTGGGNGTSISNTEYESLLLIIKNKPASHDNIDYRLKEDLLWEEYERNDPVPLEENEEDFREIAYTLLGIGGDT